MAKKTQHNLMEDLKSGSASMPLFKNLEESIIKHSRRKVFFIKNTFYTYLDLAEKISAIRNCLIAAPDNSEKKIGLVANDDLETYAAILAIWLEGKAYVPLSPQMPSERNEGIIRQSGIKTIIDSSEQALFPNYFIINSNKGSSFTIDVQPKNVSGEELAYIIFTSGSTGTPKGVPITRNNLASFMDSFSLLIPDVTEKDKCLQMFDLTFDLSIVSCLVALLKGACIFTIPKNQIKYQYVFKLLDEQKLTFAIMIPSILHYFSAYFDEIRCPDLRYNLFCGEPLLIDITQTWSHCVPNATIMNVYGPTEATAFCTYYSLNRLLPNKAHNGILSIGKTMKHTSMLIINGKNYPVKQGVTGELCLTGALTPGYLHDETKNKISFFEIEFNGKSERFYKTGDLCFVDKEGDLMFIGRMDSQVKIQGHRVELSEIEFHARAYLPKSNVIALTFSAGSKNLEVGLLIEGDSFDTRQLVSYMKTKMPSYMIPARIQFEKIFLYNNNGKIDRKKLSNKFPQQ
jgi:amino acid adenylation domain-containing protein